MRSTFWHLVLNLLKFFNFAPSLPKSFFQNSILLHLKLPFFMYAVLYYLNSNNTDTGNYSDSMIWWNIIQNKHLCLLIIKRFGQCHVWYYSKWDIHVCWITNRNNVEDKDQSSYFSFHSPYSMRVKICISGMFFSTTCVEKWMTFISWMSQCTPRLSSFRLILVTSRVEV